nr:unnamed protein product [Trichobilharzia regenti]
MTLVRELGTSELDWNRMNETNYVACSTLAGSKNNNPNLLPLLNNNTPTTIASASTAPPPTTTTSSSLSSMCGSGESAREENVNNNISGGGGGGNRGGGLVLKIFRCKLCHKFYKSRRSLLRHQISHHEQSDSQAGADGQTEC